MDRKEFAEGTKTESQSNEQQASVVLRTIARDLKLKEFVMNTPWLYQLLLAAAKRYIAGESRGDALDRAAGLQAAGYAISLEYIGENTADLTECRKATDEFLALIRESSQRGLPVHICFDLSHIGLMIDEELALSHAEELAAAARENGQILMISMEESAKTEAIYRLYERLASRHEHVGITVQAHLHRTWDDLPRLLDLPGRIRLVKGAFREEPQVALPRSKELQTRYLELTEKIVQAGHPLSIATHDQQIVQAVREQGFLSESQVELEMLCGVCEEEARMIRDEGVPLRLYVTYGTEWYLYLCHRIAEHPPQLYRALADMLEPDRVGMEVYR
ncbi:proline dehydrogenase family protein [Brevibacillus ruminantium]|uniref:proline dehydrogenase n=1 Tax=Brevibacillus ruminantium TaxID=2950604 RepID=A0ABY4WG07_9BACL|nr:proline dehydrogenase family protein [Brevibacillus ruminantium]USG64952.1 proline dehydrogenase family protein [Brevibacillus ruminantium]